MDNSRSKTTKNEILARLSRRYASAGAAQKQVDRPGGRLGYHRKSAIRAAKASPAPPPIVLLRQAYMQWQTNAPESGDESPHSIRSAKKPIAVSSREAFGVRVLQHRSRTRADVQRQAHMQWRTNAPESGDESTQPFGIVLDAQP